MEGAGSGLVLSDTKVSDADRHTTYMACVIGRTPANFTLASMNAVLCFLKVSDGTIYR